jgi:uncharacterized cupin superfamily protein
MKCSVVTKPDAEGPPLHEHPNEEQFTLVLSGQLHFVLGDEDRVIGPGTLIHVPATRVTARDRSTARPPTSRSRARPATAT